MDRELTLADEIVRESYLIQRLQKPLGKVNPFSFGGGLVNGGLSNDAMNMLKDIFSFDYMGSSEFEWGAVPNALRFIAKQACNDNLVADIMECNQGEYVYYIAPKQYEEDVKKRITQLRNNELRLKEYCGLNTYFDGFLGNERKDICGWIELDNGFMFFTNEDMFINTCKLFGIKPLRRKE